MHQARETVCPPVYGYSRVGGRAGAEQEEDEMSMAELAQLANMIEPGAVTAGR